MGKKVDILLSVFNGEKFLKCQVDSILSQTYVGWNLIIRDDGSSDDSMCIIEDYIKHYHNNMQLTDKHSSHYGINGSLLRLLSVSQADYIMFCDQDDVWMPDKIEITLKKMKELEKKIGIDMPVLIHTDLKVADKDVNVTAESFWKYQHLDPKKGKSLNRLLTQNTITGCTMMINRALKDKVKFIPEQAITYDRWIALVAALFGKIDYVTSPTMLYRQHNSNSIGAKEWGLEYISKMAKLGKSNLRVILLKTQMQAKALLEEYRHELQPEQVRLLTVFSTLDQQGFFMRRLNLLRYNFLKTGFRRNIGLFFAI
jgi:glycosyltransferase involved in cell wall biosynthesis